MRRKPLESPFTIATLLRQLTLELQSDPTLDAPLEASLLLAHALGRSRTHLFTWPEQEVEEAHYRHAQALVRRRLDGEPSAYLVGEREFWSLPFKVTPATLVPRPDSERLVELALARIPEDARWHCADLGTGSGVIAAVIARERPHCRVVATDKSSAALEVAKENFRQLGLPNVTTARGEWFAALPPDSNFDLILSNPPYVARSDPHLAQGALRHEPLDALVSGEDGLDAIRHLLSGAPAHLKPGGHLLIEHGWYQGSEIRALFGSSGFLRINTYRDLGNRERVTAAVLK